MQPSFVGLALCAALLLFGRVLGAPLTVPLIASIAFGSTAIATLGAIGGSSPLIYVVFVLVLLAATVARVQLWRDLTAVFRLHWQAWVVCLLTFYAVCGAYILPRLFAGRTSAFVPMREHGLVSEVALGPVSGNFTQTAYFALSALVFLALSAILLHRPSLDGVRKGFFAWASITAAAGVIDLAAKLAGAGDVLRPVRTATYALVTEVEQGGFWRIVGLHPEASSFGATALASLAFSFVYWKSTGSRPAFLLASLLLCLVLFSTSSTAYAGLTVLLVFIILRLPGAAMADRIPQADLVLIGLCIICAIVGIAVLVRDSQAFVAFEELFRVTILEKSTSSSALERAFWNERSLQSVLDTYALGIGLGSSRSSNWVISVLSQLGLLGALLQAILVVTLIYTPGRRAWSRRDGALIALHDGVRAAALTTLLCGSIAGGGADPGLLFFISLATVLACRFHLAASAARRSADQPVQIAVMRQRGAYPA